MQNVHLEYLWSTLIFVCKIPVKTFRSQKFFYPMKLFFVIKKMNGLKISYNHEFLVLWNHDPTECFYFRKKRGRFLTFDWSKQRSTTDQNLNFFEAVKRNRIGWDGGIFSSVFYFLSSHDLSSSFQPSTFSFLSQLCVNLPVARMPPLLPSHHELLPYYCCLWCVIGFGNPLFYAVLSYKTVACLNLDWYASNNLTFSTGV